MILMQHLRMPAAAAASAALVLLPASQPALAINENAGTTGFNFLKIPVGARPAALGGAYAAAAGKMEATAFNPAGLHGLEHRAGVVSLASYLVDTEAGFISVALPGESRVWAGSVNYFSYGSMRHTDADGQDLGSFGAFELAASVTAAQRIWRRLAVGASLKAIYSSIQDYTSDAYALDPRPPRRRTDQRHETGILDFQHGRRAQRLHRRLQGLPAGCPPGGYFPSACTRTAAPDPARGRERSE